MQYILITLRVKPLAMANDLGYRLAQGKKRENNLHFDQRQMFPELRTLVHDAAGERIRL